MSLTIFDNQTSNGTVDVKGSNDGIIQVDVSGVLDGADVVTYLLDNKGVPVRIRDCSWLTSLGDTLTNSDAATKYVQNRILRFAVENAGGSTDISLSVTHSADNLTII